MASTSEVGHNKNVANFKALCLILEEMGPLYNPSNAGITLSKLAPFRDGLDTTMSGLARKSAIFKNDVAVRETEIEPLNRKTTRSLMAFKSLDVSKADKEHVTAAAQKVRGYKKPAPKNPENADAQSISVSQQSYDNRIASLGNYIELLRTHSAYAPNESDMTTDAFSTYHSQLSESNAAAKTSGYALVTARNERDQKLYKGDTNVIDLQRTIKSYLLSIGAPGKPYYKAATKLKFKDEK